MTPFRRKIHLDEDSTAADLFSTPRRMRPTDEQRLEPLAKTPMKQERLEPLAKTPMKHEHVEIMVSTPNGSNSHLWATKFFAAVRSKQFDQTISDNQALTDENIDLRGRLNDALVLVEEYKAKVSILEEKLAHAYTINEILSKSSMKKSRRSAVNRRRSAMLNGSEDHEDDDDDSRKKAKKKRKSNVNKRKTYALDPNNNEPDEPCMESIAEDSSQPTNQLDPNIAEDKKAAKLKRRSVQMKTKPLQRSKAMVKKVVGETSKSVKIKLPDFSEIRLPQLHKRDLTMPTPFEVYNKPTRASLLRKETIRREIEAKRRKQ